MKTLFCALGLALAGCTSSAPASSVDAGVAGKHWVCPRCGNACDALVYDAPGKCKCGMTLVEQESQPVPQKSTKVAVLVFDGVEIIDFTGPWEIFGAAGFEVYSVAKTRAPVTTSMEMTIVPRFTFADAPKADIVLVPGGHVVDVRKDEETLAWVNGQAVKADRVLSVCNGAFILASAHLLDGLTATTTAPLIDELHAQFPQVQVVSDRRFVDNGKIVTSAGLSAGIDGALHVVEGISGRGWAQRVALVTEYAWRPDQPFVRAALADRLIPDFGIDDPSQWDVTTYEGDASRWEVVARPKSALEDAAILERVGRGLSAGKWTKKAATSSGSEWAFQDGKGRPWRAKVELLAAHEAGRSDAVRLSLEGASGKP